MKINQLMTLSIVAKLCFSYPIESPHVTYWGDWTEMQRCPSNQFVIGMQLKVEGDQRDSDDTALNSIMLLCASLDNIHSTTSIYATRSDGWGNWRSTSNCRDSIAIGFQLNSEGNQKKGDDTAANNLKLLCSDNSEVTGDGMSWGSWTEARRCNTGDAICGIQAQIERPQGNGDDTALNNVKMECCKLPLTPAQSCSPSDQWIPVYECQNLLSATDIECKYKMEVGMEVQTSNQQGSYLEKVASQSVTSEIGATGDILSSKFSSTVGRSTTTGYNWMTSSSSTWSRKSTQEITVNVKPGTAVRIDQVTGFCGPYRVHVLKYKTVIVPTNI